MKNTNDKKSAHILMAACLSAAAVLLCYLSVLIVKKQMDGEITGRGTKIEFNIEQTEGTGFQRDVTIYTENDITEIAFSGRIRTDGTVWITVTANEDGSTVYRKAYSGPKDETVDFVAEGLEPGAYYTFTFSSDDAKEGSLLLTAGESLRKRPERPDK